MISGVRRLTAPCGAVFEQAVVRGRVVRPRVVAEVLRARLHGVVHLDPAFTNFNPGVTHLDPCVTL